MSIKDYKSEGTNIACEDPIVKDVVDIPVKDFGADFQPLAEPESYYPTRLEYFAGKALQGVVTGRAEKDLKYAAKKALALGREMEEEFNNL